MKVLIIIPAYNEEKNILNTCNNVIKYGHNLDYIVINDGSKDDTGKILDENNLNHIDLIHNLGIGGAVQTGYKYAYENGYDIAIQFDGDGQHDMNFVSKICKPIIDNDADMVIGTRYLDKTSSKFQSTFMRRLGSSIISFFIRLLCHKKITDPTSGFRAVNKKVISEFANKYPKEYPEPESEVLLIINNYRIIEVPVSMNERTGGVSSIRFGKSVDYMIKVILDIIVSSISFRRKRGDKNCKKN